MQNYLNICFDFYSILVELYKNPAIFLSYLAHSAPVVGSPYCQKPPSFVPIKGEELSTPFLFLVACFEQAVIIASIIKGDK